MVVIYANVGEVEYHRSNVIELSIFDLSMAKKDL